MRREKVKGEKMYYDMRASLEYVYRCEWRKGLYRFVCMFKVSWKKKKRTAYLDICDQKKSSNIYSKIEIISGEYKLINKYSCSRKVLRYYMRKDLRYRSHYLYILPL